MAALQNSLGRVGVYSSLWLLMASGSSCATNTRDAAKNEVSHVAGDSHAGSPSGNGASASGSGGASSQGNTNVGGASAPSVGAYTTDFNLNESPLSEGGKWKHDGLDWTTISTSDGLAFGTQKGNGGFDDSYAYLAGTFPANQSGSAVIHLESGIASSSYQEVEILLRWTDSAHNSIGYECNLAFSGQYAEIIKWPGPRGKEKSEFKFISSGNPVAGGVHDGDTFQCDVVGSVITSRLNGKVIATGSDSSIPGGGAPGIGFYAEGAPASRKFSFSKFTGTGL